MRTWCFSLTIVATVACATTAPPSPISAAQRHQFQTTLATARRVATLWDCPRGHSQLQPAESDFLYAENSPKDPARAARMAAQAQQEAQAAIDLCQTANVAAEPIASASAP